MDKGSTTSKFYINSDQFIQRDGGENVDIPIDRVDETYIPHLGISEVSVKSAFLKKELKDFSNEFYFEKANIIYEKVMNDTRGTLIRNTVLMSNVGNFYRDAILVNLNSLYNYSPDFFASNFYTFQVDNRGIKVRTPNQYNFEEYEKYIYLLCLIVYINENAYNLKGILSKDAKPMIAWARVRNDESLKWIIAGPNDSYTNPPNFKQHYSMLISTASHLSDLLQQNLLSKTNMTYEELTDFKDKFTTNPNVYSKNLDKARQWNIVIRDARKLISTIDNKNNLIFDASHVDLGDTSNKHILAEYNSLIVEQDKETNPPSVMLSKALELLLNNYSAIHVNELSFRYDVFGNDISRFPIVYLVFPGIYTVEHTVYDDQPRGILRIAGKFTNDKENRRYKFIPNEEFLSFNGSQTFVRNFQFYITNDPNENGIIPHVQNIKFMKEEVFNHMLGTNLTFDGESSEIDVDNITVEIPMDFQSIAGFTQSSKASWFLNNLPVIPKSLENYLQNFQEHLNEYSSLQVSLSNVNPFAYTYVQFIPRLDEIHVMWFGPVNGQPGLENSVNKQFRKVVYGNSDQFEDKYGFVGSLDAKIYDNELIILPGWGMFDGNALKTPIQPNDLPEYETLLNWFSLKLQWAEIAYILNFFNNSLIPSNGKLITNIDFQPSASVDLTFINNSIWNNFSQTFGKNPSLPTFKNLINQLLIMGVDDFADKIEVNDDFNDFLIEEKGTENLTEDQALFKFFKVIELLQKFRKITPKPITVRVNRSQGTAFGLPFKLLKGNVKGKINQPLNGKINPPNVTANVMNMIRQRGSTYGMYSGPSPLAYTNSQADYRGSQPTFMNETPTTSQSPYLNISGRSVSGIIRPRSIRNDLPGAQRQMQTASDCRSSAPRVQGGINTSYEPLRHFNLQSANVYGSIQDPNMPMALTPNNLFTIPASIPIYGQAKASGTGNTLILSMDNGEKYMSDEENFVSLIRFYQEDEGLTYEPLTSFIYDQISRQIQLLPTDVSDPYSPRIDLKFSPDLYIYFNRNDITSGETAYLSEANSPLTITDMMKLNMNLNNYVFTGYAFEIDNHVEISKLDYNDVFGLEFIKSYPSTLDLSNDIPSNITIDVFQFTIRSGDDYIIVGVDGEFKYGVLDYSESIENSRFLAWLNNPTGSYVPQTNDIPIDQLMKGTYSSSTASQLFNKITLTAVGNQTQLEFYVKSTVIEVNVKVFEPVSGLVFQSGDNVSPWLSIQTNPYRVSTYFISSVQDVLTTRVLLDIEKPNEFSNVFRGQSIAEIAYDQHWNRSIYILSLIMTPIPILPPITNTISNIWFRSHSTDTYIYTVENDFPFITSSGLINEKYLNLPIPKTFHNVVLATPDSILVDNIDLGTRTCYVYSHQIYNYETDDFTLNDLINREKYDINQQDEIIINLNTSNNSSITIKLFNDNGYVRYFDVTILGTYIQNTISVNGNIESGIQYIVPLSYFGTQIQGELTIMFTLIENETNKYVAKVNATVNFSYLTRLNYVDSVPTNMNCYHLIPDSSMTSYTTGISNSPLSLNFLTSTIENPTIPIFRYFQNNIDSDIYTDQDNKDPFIINRNEQVFTNTRSRLGKNVDPDLINLEPLAQSIDVEDEFVTENVNGLIKLSGVDNSKSSDEIAISSREGVLLMAPNDNLLLSLNIE